jgi:hypothetical protein
MDRHRAETSVHFTSRQIAALIRQDLDTFSKWLNTRRSANAYTRMFDRLTSCQLGHKVYHEVSVESVKYLANVERKSSREIVI